MEKILEGKDPKLDYYSVLGCDELSSTEQILTEYKVRALKIHPDKKTEDSSQDEFYVLQRAKEVLKDPSLRKLYDQWRHSRIAIDFEEWFSRKELSHASMHWAGTEKKKAMISEKESIPKPSSSIPPKNVIEAFRNYQI